MISALIGLLGLAVVVMFGYAIARDRRKLRRWREERERIAEMHEQLAREAVRPNGHVENVISIERRRS